MRRYLSEAESPFWTEDRDRDRLSESGAKRPDMPHCGQESFASSMESRHARRRAVPEVDRKVSILKIEIEHSVSMQDEK